MKPGDIFKEFYGYDKKIRKLALTYASLIEGICSDADKENIEKIGDFRFRNKIMETGLKNLKKEKGKENIYRDMLFRRWGFNLEKFDDNAVKKTQKELKEVEEKCKTIETLPRTKKTLLELSEYMGIPVEDLEGYVRKAEKNGVVKKTENGSFQLTTKGLEVAYSSLLLKKYETGKFFTLGKDF